MTAERKRPFYSHPSGLKKWCYKQYQTVTNEKLENPFTFYHPRNGCLIHDKCFTFGWVERTKDFSWFSSVCIYSMRHPGHDGRTGARLLNEDTKDVSENSPQILVRRVELTFRYKWYAYKEKGLDTDTFYCANNFSSFGSSQNFSRITLKSVGHTYIHT